MSQNELFDPHDYDLKRNINNKDDPYFNEKILHEIHRMTGLLRFTPNEDGVFIAKCAPDYFILPALAHHFTARFGDASWEIIDEKRGLCLSRMPGKKAIIKKAGTQHSVPEFKKDEWIELWQHYNKTINNENRNNPNLQRRLMPQRYWKYLPEMQPDH